MQGPRVPGALGVRCAGAFSLARPGFWDASGWGVDLEPGQQHACWLAIGVAVFVT